MHLIIRTPDKDHFDGQADAVRLQTELGEMEILPGHASLQGTIVFSPLRVRNGNEEEDFVVQRGFAMVDSEKDTITVLVYGCEKRAELSYKTAQEYLAFIVQSLEKRESFNQYQIDYLEGERIAMSKTVEFLARENEVS